MRILIPKLREAINLSNVQTYEFFQIFSLRTERGVKGINFCGRKIKAKPNTTYEPSLACEAKVILQPAQQLVPNTLCHVRIRPMC